MTLTPAPLLTVTDLIKHFSMSAGRLGRPALRIQAVNGVSFFINHGERLGLVGESGCGKTTLARLVVRLLNPSSGSIRFGDQEIAHLNRREMRPLRKRMQIIFQDPLSSLDPRMTVAASVTEPLLNGNTLSKRQRRDLAGDLLRTVGLRSRDGKGYPHQFSGGQRQRICIARALCVKPQLVVADEPVSALDVSIQAQILNLMMDLQQRYGLAYLFISHDISVVEHFCDRVAVMYAGRLVEIAAAKQFHTTCRHPYARALVAAVPPPDPRERRPAAPMAVEPPDPTALPPGCPYHPRCPHASSQCRLSHPPTVRLSDNHQVACWLTGL